MKNFLLFRIGYLLAYAGGILGFFCESPCIIVYVGGSGAILCLMFSWCPQCRTNLLEYYTCDILGQLTFFVKLITFQKLECPYCKKMEDSWKEK
jgi:hypothetical protein